MTTVHDNHPEGKGLTVALGLVESHIRTRPGSKNRDGSRQKIPYLSWTDTATLLDIAFGVGGWSVDSDIKWPPAGSAFPPLVQCTITAGGAAKTAHARVISVKKADGTLMQPIKDVEQLADGTRWTIGADPFEVAERAAFCRAATYFGIRVGYDRAEQAEEDSNDEPQQERRREQPQRRERPQRQAPRQAEQSGNEKPDTFTADGLEWRKTKGGDGYTAKVDPDEYSGAVRLLVKEGNQGDYGATAFDDDGLMSDIGWHNADNMQDAVALLLDALGVAPF